MDDPTEAIRRDLQVAVNASTDTPPDAMTTEEMSALYEVKGFMAPYVVVCRKADGVTGSLMFRHHPRIYFGWVEDEP